jgi:hypothetical protein
MENQIVHLSFDEWVRYVFDRPQPIIGPSAWYRADEFWIPTRHPNITVSYLTSLFENPVSCLSAYSDAQINSGLWFLISDDHMGALQDGRVPLPDRIKGLQSMYIVFEALFRPFQRNKLPIYTRDNLDKPFAETR